MHRSFTMAVWALQFLAGSCVGFIIRQAPRASSGFRNSVRLCGDFPRPERDSEGLSSKLVTREPARKHSVDRGKPTSGDASHPKREMVWTRVRHRFEESGMPDDIDSILPLVEVSIVIHMCVLRKYRSSPVDFFLSFPPAKFNG